MRNLGSTFARDRRIGAGTKTSKHLMSSIWSNWTYYELKNSQNVLESLISFVITCLSVVPQLVNPAVALLVLRVTFGDDAMIQLQAEVRFSVVIEGRGDRVRPL